MKLPHGKFLKFTQKKIKNLCEIFYNDTNVRLVFSTTKISFPPKDKIPNALKSFVVYKFLCVNCMASYVGETCRYLDERINEHFKSNSSQIFKHLNSKEACKEACDNTCCHVIDTDCSAFRLKPKETMYISWLTPELNKLVSGKYALPIPISQF